MRTSRRLAPVLALAVLAACTGGGDDEGGRRPPPDATTTTTVVDRSGVVLAGVPGETTTTTAPATGAARITGVVQGPTGAVPGAVVRIERLVGGQEVRTDLVTGPDGRYLLEGAPGGRYRLRAFLPPSLAQLEPEVRFLADGEEHDVPLVVEEQHGLVTRVDVAPDPPMLGRAVNLVAVVANLTVDGDGVVRAVPVVGATVELAGLGRWVLRDDRDDSGSSSSGRDTGFGAPSPDAVTDSRGSVRYELRCHQAGRPGLYLRVPVRAPAPPEAPGGTDVTVGPFPPTTVTSLTIESLDLDVPACLDPATTTTAPPSTAATDGTTTTR